MARTARLRRPRFPASPCLVLACALVSACSGGDGSGGGPTPAVPVITSLSPASITAGGPSFTLTVGGTNFVTGSVVLWNGADRPTTVGSTTQLSAVISAADIATPGTAQVAVRNPAPVGGSSAAVAYVVGAPPPVLSSLEPASVAAGSAPLVLTLRGTSFVSGTVARWRDESLATTLRDSTELAAEVSAARLQTLGDVAVSVANPPPGGGESASLPLRVGGVLRTSVTYDGTDVDGGSDISAISADGRFIAFASKASHLLPGDTNDAFDVFVRDTCLGAAAGCVPQTFLASAGVGGVPSNLHSTHVAISRSGLLVAFISSATNLVANDTNGAFDVFVRNTCGSIPGNCLPETIRVSVSDAGAQSDRDSLHPSSSGDERYIVFASSGTNLVAGDTNDSFDVFRRDTCFGAGSGCVPSTLRVSLTSAGQQSTGGHGILPESVVRRSLRVVRVYGIGLRAGRHQQSRRPVPARHLPGRSTRLYAGNDGTFAQQHR